MGAYEDEVKSYLQKMSYPNREGLTTILTEIGKLLPEAAHLEFSDVADAGIIEQVDRSGFLNNLYK